MKHKLGHGSVSFAASLYALQLLDRRLRGLPLLGVGRVTSATAVVVHHNAVLHQAEEANVVGICIFEDVQVGLFALRTKQQGVTGFLKKNDG